MPTRPDDVGDGHRGEPDGGKKYRLEPCRHGLQQQRPRQHDKHHSHVVIAIDEQPRSGGQQCQRDAVHQGEPAVDPHQALEVTTAGGDTTHDHGGDPEIGQAHPHRDEQHRDGELAVVPGAQIVSGHRHRDHRGAASPVLGRSTGWRTREPSGQPTPTLRPHQVPSAHSWLTGT